jgi:hypothetical protein
MCTNAHSPLNLRIVLSTRVTFTPTRVQVPILSTYSHETDHSVSERESSGLPVFWLEGRVTDYLYCVWKSGLRITCTLFEIAGYGLPLLWLEERVADYLHSDWKSGLRITFILSENRVTNDLYSDGKSGLWITCTQIGRAGYELPVLWLEERVAEDGSFALASPPSRRCCAGPSVRLGEK